MRHAVLGLALAATASSCASIHGDDGAAMASEDGTQYLMSYRKSDPRFMRAIERVGPCKVPGAPTQKMIVPWELYPAESVNFEPKSVEYVDGAPTITVPFAWGASQGRH